MILQLNILIFTAVAALMDLKWWKVKNLWLLAGLTGGIAYRLLCRESPDIVQGLAGMAVPLLLLGVFWYAGLMGAGDVKLFSVIGFWTGTALILEFMLFSLASGAVYFLILASVKPEENILKKKIHVAVCAFISALCLMGGIYG